MSEVLTDEQYRSQLANEHQVKFCHLYAYSEKRGNGVLCYAEAYDIDLNEPGAYNSARAAASRLLTNGSILSYIRYLYESSDLSDDVVDNELAFVIKQNADFGSKVAAIKEYNQLKQRIIKKIEHSGAVDTGDISDDKFNKLLAAAREGAQANSSK